SSGDDALRLGRAPLESLCCRERPLPATGEHAEPAQKFVRHGPDERWVRRRVGNDPGGGGAQFRATLQKSAAQTLEVCDRGQSPGRTLYVREQFTQGGAAVSNDFASEQVLSLDVVGAFEDRADAGITEYLGDLRVVDVAGSTVDLDTERGDLETDVRYPGLDDGSKEVRAAHGSGARLRLLPGMSDVDRCGRGVCETARRMQQGFHGQQHPAYVGMLDDRAL